MRLHQLQLLMQRKSVNKNRETLYRLWVRRRSGKDRSSILMMMMRKKRRKKKHKLLIQGPMLMLGLELKVGICRIKEVKYCHLQNKPRIQRQVS
jgi:hypothetical protein